MNTLIWFIHFHKCAGTSLVDSLLEGGYRPAACHHNGNPVDASGRQIDFTNFDAHKLSSYIDTAIESGTTVICSEFSNPRMDWLKRDKRVKVVTILRHPIRETLENPAHLRENGAVITGQDWVNGRQAARFHGL